MKMSYPQTVVYDDFVGTEAEYEKIFRNTPC